MRIAVVHPRMSIWGGGERVAIHSIAASLRDRHEVYFASEEFDIDRFEDFFGCQGLLSRVRRISYPTFKPITTEGLMLYQQLVYHQYRLRQALSNGPKFDLIISTQDIGYVPSVTAPVVQYCYFPEYFAHLEEDASSAFHRLYYWPASLFYRNRVSHVHRFLSVSEYTREFVMKKWGRNSETLYPPCPVELFDSQDEAKEDLVITSGRVVPEKRVELFVEIARRLPSYRFAVIGSVMGQGSRYLESLQRRAPANLSFMMSPLRKAASTLAKAKAYVHCAEGEHFGISIVEAMAAGCVPVVHDTGGPREIVSEDVGFRWNNLEEACAQTFKVMSDDGLRRKLSAGARARSKVYRSEVFESKLARVLKEYAGQS